MCYDAADEIDFTFDLTLPGKRHEVIVLRLDPDRMTGAALREELTWRMRQLGKLAETAEIESFVFAMSSPCGRAS